MKNIPNFFTLLNLVLGCLAIVYILQNGLVITTDAQGSFLVDIPEKIWLASLFIGLAALADFLDGLIARLLHESSEMGKQLDSLADIVSFGVAPALILFQLLRLSLAQGEDGLQASVLWLLPAFILPCAAAWRLAKFNLNTTSSLSFSGMPVPAVGIFVASLPLIYWNVNIAWVQDLLLNNRFLYALITVLSWLMLSKIPMLSLKFKDFSVRNNMPKYLLILFSIISLLVLQWLAVPVIILLYVLLSLLFKSKTQ